VANYVFQRDATAAEYCDGKNCKPAAKKKWKKLKIKCVKRDKNMCNVVFGQREHGNKIKMQNVSERYISMYYMPARTHTDTPP